MSITGPFPTPSGRDSEPERVLDMLHQDPFTVHEHAHDIEPVRLVGTTVTIDPDVRALREFALFSVIHGLDGITELTSLPRLHFDEGDELVTLGDEVDITAPVPKTPIHDPPSLSGEPSGRDPLANVAEALVVLAHGAEGIDTRHGVSTANTPARAFYCPERD
jgi:hypothetical protein